MQVWRRAAVVSVICFGVVAFLHQHFLLSVRDVPVHVARPVLAVAAKSLFNGSVPVVQDWQSWRPRWSGIVPSDRKGLGAKVWEELQTLPDPTAYNATRRLLQAAIDKNVSLAVVQVGACDGKWEDSNDPVQELLRHPRVRAIALEPVPYLWRDLAARFATLPNASGRLLPVNGALCLEAKASAPFFVVSSRFAADHPDAGHWAKRELGSFQKSHLRKHHIPNQYIEQIDVPCLAPPQLFERVDSPVGNEPSNIDAVVVDAEGLDADLVEALLRDVRDFRPALVIFEQKHVPRKRLRTVLDQLRKLRYVFWTDRDQLVALLAAPTDDKL
eukprot:TRINITY_DN50469_c0_g1_i1.p1 TRINITY_DN50469_c0_g1~~TRINITY_DN50469_c0_g1_i1.p1  ORF type:complete len:329 (-),score=55.46 TRINITY_DN50469_c0_g1_i1:89-1075(-)